MEQVKPVLKNIYQRNIYRRDLNWPHFDDEPRVQENQEVKVQQSSIFSFIACLTIPSSNQGHQPRRNNSIPYMGVWQIYRDKELPEEKETSQNKLRLQFFWRQFQQQRQCVQFRREGQSQHLKRLFFLKNRPIHFHINRTSVIRPIKQNQLSFTGNKISKSLLTPVYSVSKIRFKFRRQFKLLPQIRCLITLKIKSSIIRIDNNITDTISRKVINVQQEKCRTKDGPLRNSTISWIFL